jgi:hypothetical protein
MMENIEACLFGRVLSKHYDLLTGVRMNRFMFNAIANWARLKGRVSNCYNNTVAPFNMQGMYLSQGDVYLKAGNFKLARMAYENTLVAPNVENWQFTDLVHWRLANMQKAREKFIADSGKFNVDTQPVTILGQSTYYCSSCHANSTQKENLQ